MAQSSAITAIARWAADLEEDFPVIHQALVKSGSEARLLSIAANLHLAQVAHSLDLQRIHADQQFRLVESTNVVLNNTVRNYEDRLHVQAPVPATRAVARSEVRRIRVVYTTASPICDACCDVSLHSSHLL